MRQLFMLKDLNSNDEKKEIVTRDGKKVYTVKSFDDNGLTCANVYDANENECVRVERHSGTDLPCLDVIVNNQVKFTVEQSDSLSKMSFNIMSDDLEVFDDWWSMDFDVMSGYRKVSKVRNRWTALGDAYELTIFEDGCEASTTGLILALDSIKAIEAQMDVVK